MRKLLTLCLVLLISRLEAQFPQPVATRLYADDAITQIAVWLNTDSLQALLDPANRWNDYEYPANVIFHRGNQWDTLYDVGFRLRGNTSRNAQKKSFKISINRFTSGRRFEGVKKINLNGEHNDPSMSRARWCWELGRQWGLPVSRVNHTRLYINGRYRGVYLNLEHINDDWLAHRFSNNGGNLYKCTWPADLQYLSNNPDDYKYLRSDGTRAYELKTNEDQDDYSDLAQLIDVLNNTPLAQLECALDPLFNIEGYLKVLAFEVSTGHWDNYAYNKNNFYLYHDPESGKFHYLPYDMDNTLGVDWLNEDWAQRNVLQWPNSGMSLPLAQRLMQISSLKEVYKYYLREFNGLLGDPRGVLQIDSIYQQIAPYAQLDSFRTFDYGFSYVDFQQSFNGNQQLGHVKESIGTFISRRVANTQQQLGSFDAAPIVTQVQLQWQSSQGDALITTLVEDESTPQVVLEYRVNGGSLQNLTMLDNGVDDDGVAGNGIYGGQLQGLSAGATLTYQVKAADPSGRERRRPCTPEQVGVPQSGPLLINEFMADNAQTIADEDGDYSDWIELYNSTADSIWLGAYYLTDDLNQPFKWNLPDAYLLSGGFQLIWASNKSGTYPWHTNFALSKNGEEIGLFRSVFGQADTVDYRLFGVQQEDVSEGRSYDASPLWVNFSQPTPNASNGSLSNEELLPLQEDWAVQVYPNPATDHITLDFPLNLAAPSAWVNVRLTDLHGRELQQWHIAQTGLPTNLSVRDIPNGVYLLKLEGAAGGKYLRLAIMR